jgi:NADH-ubiquinone oxidoreductase chain 4L
MILIAIELLILCLVIILINLSYIFDDILGNLLSILLLPLSGAESALGLMILIQYYPIRGSLYIK